VSSGWGFFCLLVVTLSSGAGDRFFLFSYYFWLKRVLFPFFVSVFCILLGDALAIGH